MIKNYIKVAGMLFLSLFVFKGTKVNAQQFVGSLGKQFNFVDSIERWTVPNCVDYITVEAIGAQGGDGFGGYAQPSSGGHGADMYGIFNVTPGDVLHILVGQKPGPSAYPGSATGGGGGSFVWDSTNSNTLLIAAGGGGGGNSYYNVNSNGIDASTGYNGTSGNGSANLDIAPGGSGGNGGSAYWEGAAGAGWNSNGANSSGGCSTNYGGQTPLNGGAGGYGNAGNGGFGGGGGAGNCYYSAGGGGGYSGGAGAGAYFGVGGGGGSYNGGFNQNNFVSMGTGHGVVKITYFVDSVLSPVTIQAKNVTCPGFNDGQATATSIGNPALYYSWAPGGQNTPAIGGLSPSTYTVSVNGYCGLTVTASVTITQAATFPSISLSETDATTDFPCNGKAWITGSGGTAPYAYNWYNNGEYTDTIKGICPNRYCAYLTDANGCNSPDDCITVGGPPLGVNSISANTDGFEVYPNPSNGVFTITSSASSPCTLEVYNVLGEKVYTANMNATSTHVNLADKPAGVYIYKVLTLTGEQLSQGKLIIE